MNRIRGVSRDQLMLFPEALDDFVAQDNPVRFIDDCIDSLDFQTLSFQHAILRETEPPIPSRRSLEALYLWFPNRIRSSRMLERVSHRNLEVTCLIKRLTPDFPGRDRLDHRRLSQRQPPALSPGVPRIQPLLPSADLFSGDLVAIDGSIFKAAKRRDHNITRKQPKRTIKHHWDQGHFPSPGQCRLTRGLSNARAEIALKVLAYRSCSLTAQQKKSDQGPGGAHNDRSPDVIRVPFSCRILGMFSPGSDPVPSFEGGGSPASFTYHTVWQVVRRPRWSSIQLPHASLGSYRRLVAFASHKQ
jgi:transposase